MNVKRRLLTLGLLGLMLAGPADAKKRGSGSGRKSGGGKGAGGGGGCGSKGGPGYRKPNGKCASWKD
jgi:hypothetical protein